jgi:EF hand
MTPPATQSSTKHSKSAPTQCPGGTRPEQVVDSESRDPCTGISADKIKRDYASAGDGSLLHEIVDKKGDGVLDLKEFLEWGNYSTGNTLTDYKSVKPWIRWFFAYDQDGDGKVSVGEVERPGSNVTWVG